jgi:Cu+-exporting ATPase
MLRSALIAATLFFAAPALACPMADAAAFNEAAAKVDKASGTKATFSVEGLTCGSCSEKVSAALTKLPGVTAAAVDYQTGKTKVAFDGAKVTKADLLAAISSAGFKAKEEG